MYFVNFFSIIFTGKIVAAAAAVSGILIIALTVPVVAGNFSSFYESAKILTRRSNPVFFDKACKTTTLNNGVNDNDGPPHNINVIQTDRAYDECYV